MIIGTPASMRRRGLFLLPLYFLVSWEADSWSKRAEIPISLSGASEPLYICRRCLGSEGSPRDGQKSSTETHHLCNTIFIILRSDPKGCATAGEATAPFTPRRTVKPSGLDRIDRAQTAVTDDAFFS